MAQLTSEVRLAPGGDVYVGPVGAVVPTDVTTAWATVDPDWKAAGYLTPDGISITPNTDFGAIKAWQSVGKLKQPLTDVSYECSFSMMQVNETTTGLYFFGGAWTAGAVAKLEISGTPTDLERSLGIEWTDDEGSKNRLIIYRGNVTNREAMQLQREEATVFGITFEALDTDGLFAEWITDNIDLNPGS